MIAAGEQLSEALGDGGPAPWPVHLAFSRFDAVRSFVPGTILVASPLKDLSPLGRPFVDVEALWRRWVGQTVAETGPTLLLTMLFRAVPAGEDARVIERIRRLNLLMAELSLVHSTSVVDLDRTLTFFGASRLATSHRLGGTAGAEAAGHAIATALLAAGLGPEIPGDVQAAAARRHGGLPELWPAVRRRIHRRGGASR